MVTGKADRSSQSVCHCDTLVWRQVGAIPDSAVITSRSNCFDSGLRSAHTAGYFFSTGLHSAPAAIVFCPRAKDLPSTPAAAACCPWAAGRCVRSPPDSPPRSDQQCRTWRNGTRPGQDQTTARIDSETRTTSWPTNNTWAAL